MERQVGQKKNDDLLKSCFESQIAIANAIRLCNRFSKRYCLQSLFAFAVYFILHIIVVNPLVYFQLPQESPSFICMLHVLIAKAIAIEKAL